MSKIKKEWKVCSICTHLKSCETGKSRIQNLPYNSPIAEEIGCFDYSIYLQNKNNQMKLF